MSEQQVDTAQLRTLVETMAQLTQYTDTMKQGAAGFAYMLPAEWQGPAFSQFLTAFELWATTAVALSEQSAGLEQLATAARDAYEGTIEGLDSTWSSARSQFGA